jgi:microcompartment protein CcmL/EutN
MAAAIGMIEVEGVAGIVVAADAACKAAQVELIGWDSIGGFTTVFFSGTLSDVTAALRHGEQAAKQVVEKVVAATLSQPEPACRLFATVPIHPDLEVQPGALGLIETRGYGLHVQANDRMVKAADVRVWNVLTVANRVVCSLIQGDVGAVREAIAVGLELVNASQHFMCSALIPQPLPEVLRAFGPPRARARSNASG